jgi:hypothetical protein
VALDDGLLAGVLRAVEAPGSGWLSIARHHDEGDARSDLDENHYPIRIILNIDLEQVRGTRVGTSDGAPVPLTTVNLPEIRHAQPLRGTHTLPTRR